VLILQRPCRIPSVSADQWSVSKVRCASFANCGRFCMAPVLEHLVMMTTLRRWEHADNVWSKGSRAVSSIMRDQSSNLKSCKKSVCSRRALASAASPGESLEKLSPHRLPHQLLVCKVIGHYLPYRRVPEKDERRENRLCTTTPKFECLSVCISCRVPSVYLHQNATCIVLPSPEKM
jgi:hypothetical protein